MHLDGTHELVDVSDQDRVVENPTTEPLEYERLPNGELALLRALRAKPERRALEIDACVGSDKASDASALIAAALTFPHRGCLGTMQLVQVLDRACQRIGRFRCSSCGSPLAIDDSGRVAFDTSDRSDA